jgi:outer membrane protein assembly factor BamB
MQQQRHSSRGYKALLAFSCAILLLLPILSHSYAAEKGEDVAVAEDWPTLGGGSLREFHANYDLTPPLQLRWKYKTGGGPDAFPISSSPAVYGKLVYAGGKDGILRALSVDDGKEVWIFKTKGVIRSSPTVANSRVYVGSEDGNVYALDASSGKLVWQFKTEDKVWSSATVSQGKISLR